MTGVETLEKDGYRVDSSSQKILWALRAPWHDDGWVRGSSLRNAAELSQNRQVFYRVEEYLDPAGLVEEKERRRESDPRAFRLTDEGERWVDAHEETLAAPVNRRETQQLAREAMDEAEAAKESVQGYRKKLHRVKSDVDELKERSGEQADRIDDVKSTTTMNAIRINQAEDEKADEEESRERLRAAKQDLKDENRQLRDRVRSLEAALEDEQERTDSLSEDVTALQERLEAIEEELGKSWTSKFRGG